MWMGPLAYGRAEVTVVRFQVLDDMNVVVFLMFRQN
jgi:hypothetical protein